MHLHHALLLGAALAASVSAQGSLEVEIERRMAAGHVTGLSACVVKDADLVWADAFGFADLERGRPATTDTIWSWGSISKSLTATALMQLWDEGRFDLDDHVNDQLAFTLQHPDAATAPITYRQILSHTGGLAEGSDELWRQTVVRGDWERPLELFLAQYLDPAGRLYSADLNFTAFGPGEGFEYSNVGYAVAGHLVERLSGLGFDEYCRTKLFARLGMRDTDWKLSELDESRLATGYWWDESSGRQRAVEAYSLPIYPAGMLRSTAPEIARFALAHLGQGSWRGRTLISPAAAAIMQQPQTGLPGEDYGFGFVIHPGVFGGHDLLWHDGGGPGLSAHMLLVPALGVGVVVAANASDEAELGWSALFDIALVLLAAAPSM